MGVHLAVYSTSQHIESYGNLRHIGGMMRLKSPYSDSLELRIARRLRASLEAESRAWKKYETALGWIGLSGRVLGRKREPRHPGRGGEGF